MADVWISGFNGFHQIESTRRISVRVHKIYKLEQNLKCVKFLITWSKIICFCDNLGILWCSRKETEEKLMPGDKVKTAASVGEDLIYLYEDNRFLIRRDGCKDLVVDSIGDQGKIQVLCGNDASLKMVSENGQLCSLNVNGDCKVNPAFPMHINSPVKVDTVSCGKEHTVVLGRDGQVYTFGNGSRGQLGLGDLITRTEPCVVEALAGIRYKTVAAGGWHSLALSEFNDVYVWGWNESGQLGLPCKTSNQCSKKCAAVGEKDTQCSNTQACRDITQDSDLIGNMSDTCDKTDTARHKETVQVDFNEEVINKSTCNSVSIEEAEKQASRNEKSEHFNDKNVQEVIEHQTKESEDAGKSSCDRDDSRGLVMDTLESCILMQDVEARQIQCTPYPLDFPDTDTIKTISCGSRHTAILTDDGVLWTCGWNAYYQLCHSNMDTKDYLQTVDTFIKLGLKVKDVFCGYWNTVVITDEHSA